jgi:hypothetical protein
MITSHYPSFKLCKKLTEIGFPATELFYTASTKYWRRKSFISDWENNQPFFKNYKCPSVMEMLDVMPEYINSDSCLTISKHSCSYENTTIMHENSYIWSTFIVSHSHNLPDAIAEMIIWLYEHKYITFTK